MIRAVGNPTAVALVRALERLTSRALGLAVVYHRVDERGSQPEQALVPVHSRALFSDQLAVLRRMFRLVRASELHQATVARRRGERFPLAITFDDDSPLHRRFAMPALVEHGAPATFFLSGASLERPHAFWWERIQGVFDAGRAEAAGLRGDLHAAADRIATLPHEEREAFAASLAPHAGPAPAMPADDVAALAAAGAEIGFHTRRHEYLPALDDRSLGRALDEGRAELEKAAGRRLEAIGYPHGGCDERVAMAARRAGFSAGFSGTHAAVRASSDPLRLPRVEPPTDSAARLALRLARLLVTEAER